MLDINLIRKDPEFVKAALAKREYEVDFTELLQWDARRKEIIAEGEALKAAIEERIREKTDESLVGNMVSEGTTPRRLTDLIGSLCDLTSGSGDKGTPIVYIQGYFDNYSND